MIAKLEWRQSNTQQNIEQLQNPTMGVSNNIITTALERTAAKATGGVGGLNAFYWYQIFARDSAVVDSQNVKLAWRVPNYCNVSSWRNNLTKLTNYDETKMRPRLKLSHGGPSYR